MNVVARVHLYPPYHNAGAEMMLHALLRALVGRGHECSVYLTEPTGELSSFWLDGVRVVPKNVYDDEKAVKAADVVITHLQASSQTRRIAGRFGVPVVYLVHNDFAVTTGRELADPPELTVFNSRHLAESLGDLATGIVVHPPVDVAEYRVERTGDHITLINLMESKGADVFWRLAAALPDVPFLGVKGGYGKQQVRTGLSNVTIMDHTPQIRRAYARTKILLMPSTYESWGRVGVEAMVSGIPVIAAPTPGLTEALDDAGIFVDHLDLEGWVSTIRRLLDDPEVYAKASSAARQRALDLDPADDLARFCDAVEALA